MVRAFINALIIRERAILARGIALKWQAVSRCAQWFLGEKNVGVLLCSFLFLFVLFCSFSAPFRYFPAPFRAFLFLAGNYAEARLRQDEQDELRIDQNPPIRLCGLAHGMAGHPGKAECARLDWPTEIPTQENPGVFCQRTASLTNYYSHITVEYANSFGRFCTKM
jgi:hypothetical protein